MSKAATDYKSDLMALASQITAAYSLRNHLSPAALPALIESVHASLVKLASGQPAVEPEPVQKMTESQIRKSITSDALISFVDGMPYKTLKRHLSTHGLDPSSYRARYGLPPDYPMVAASYSQRRSIISKGVDFGRKRKDRPVKPTVG